MVSLRPDYGHLPGLDGLRAVAVSIVLVAHLGFPHIVPGGFGVTLFFFISGMLITRLLMAEFSSFGRLNIPKFYLRRFLRLYPALLLAVTAHCVLYPKLGGAVTWGEVSASLFYYANYFNQLVVFGSAGHTPVGSFHPLGVQWSLAIEEQYYLIFPLLLTPLLKSGKRLLATLIILVVISFIWRCILQYLGLGDRNYSSTDTRLDSIIYGALLTVLLARPNGGRVQEFLQRPTTVGLALVVLLSTFLIRDDAFRNTLRYSLQGLALMPLVTRITFAEHKNLIHKVLASRPLVLLGAWSYSLYLFHPHAILITENVYHVDYLAPFNQKPGLFFILAIGLSFLFATFSYYCVERRFLALRSRFGSHSANAVEPTPAQLPAKTVI